MENDKRTDNKPASATEHAQERKPNTTFEKCIKQTNFCAVHLKSLDQAFSMAKSLRTVQDQLERTERELVGYSSQISMLEDRNNALENKLNRILRETEGRLHNLECTINTWNVDSSFFAEDSLQDSSFDQDSEGYGGDESMTV